MVLYIKNKVEVEADLFHEDTFRKSEFLKRAVQDKANMSEMWFYNKAKDGRYYLNNPEGMPKVLNNDVYVIKGEGGYYSCEAELFAKNYVKKDECETVTISKEEYENLLSNNKFLNSLEALGVDNWDGYSEAWEMSREDNN